mgnify:CR=1 FL=1
MRKIGNAYLHDIIQAILTYEYRDIIKRLWAKGRLLNIKPKFGKYGGRISVKVKKEYEVRLLETKLGIIDVLYKIEGLGRPKYILHEVKTSNYSLIGLFRSYSRILGEDTTLVIWAWEDKHKEALQRLDTATPEEGGKEVIRLFFKGGYKMECYYFSFKEAQSIKQSIDKGYIVLHNIEDILDITRECIKKLVKILKD